MTAVGFIDLFGIGHRLGTGQAQADLKFIFISKSLFVFDANIS